MNPAQLLTTTAAVDPVFYFIFGVSAVILIGITVVMVWFVIRYRHSRAPEPTSQLDHHLGLEIAWTTIPTILVLAMFWAGWAGYLALRQVPDNALPVTAVARMWSWSFEYENGKKASKLYVPVGRPVKVELVSRDVLHAFYVPAFRVKRDTVPGMHNQVWFVAPKAGSYDIFCAEYCGVQHAAMTSTVEALPLEEFERWLATSDAGDGEDQGRGLLESLGCLGCHSLDGSPSAGPSFKGIWGRTTALEGGKQLIADETYLRRALLEPNAEVVKGFPPIMPSFADQLGEEQLKALIATLKGTP